jgi:hypothetical protein
MKARSNVLGLRTKLQAERSRVRFTMRLLDFFFFNLPNLSSGTMALRSNQPLTETSTRNITGGKDWPERKASTSPPPVNRSSSKYGSLDVSL